MSPLIRRLPTVTPDDVASVNIDCLGCRVFATESKKDNDRKSSSRFIDLDTLKNFESVTDQFLEQGIRFENAIALQPSNPAFPESGMGAMVLIGAPQQGFIDATFVQPIYQLEACITSSRSLMMTAFDGQNQVLDQTAINESNLLDNIGSSTSPHTHLVLKSQGSPIHRVLFCCTGGNFTLTHLCLQL